MGTLFFLTAGYVVFWLITFIFAYSLVSRQQTLQNDLETLERLAEQEDHPE